MLESNLMYLFRINDFKVLIIKLVVHDHSFRLFIPKFIYICVLEFLLSQNLNLIYHQFYSFYLNFLLIFF